MPFIEHSAKKQASMPGPNSSAYKKLLAAQRGAAPNLANSSLAPSSVSQPGEKPHKLSSTFSSIRSRQRIVERVKRAIWASVLSINDAIIKLALAGNYNAAKALFEFAGVYSLPCADNDSTSPALASAAVPAPAADTGGDATNPIEAFFRSIGVPQPCDEPQPGLSAADMAAL
jgi:hypothetical protein